MKVYVTPPANLSRAMTRVATALAFYAPPDIDIVADRTQADLEVLHVIGIDGLDDAMTRAASCAIIQYCTKSTSEPNGDMWRASWERARLVWSYYDLSPFGGGTTFNFYYAPLGVDPIFATPRRLSNARDIGVMTSGYVSSSHGEAIQEVATAATSLGKTVVHLGPRIVQGMDRIHDGWSSVHGIDDATLVSYYSRSQWVSGLRHIEGFELPALEGLLCGARPVLFDREEMRQWYDGHAVFIPECHGPALVDVLTEVFRSEPELVSGAERHAVSSRFDWATIARGFWSQLSSTQTHGKV